MPALSVFVFVYWLIAAKKNSRETLRLNAHLTYTLCGDG